MSRSLERGTRSRRSGVVAAAAAFAVLALADVASADTGLGPVPTPEASATVTSQVTPVTQAVQPVAQAAQPVVQAAQPTTVPVAEAAAPAVETVNDAAAPVTQQVAETTAPVVQAAAPVTETVAEVAAPVVVATVDAAAPVVETVTQTVAPVVERASRTVAPAVETARTAVAPVVTASEPVVAAARTSPTGTATTVAGSLRAVTDLRAAASNGDVRHAATSEAAPPSVAPGAPALPVVVAPPQSSIGRGEGGADELPAAAGSSIVKPDTTVVSGTPVAEPPAVGPSVETTTSDGRGTVAGRAPGRSSDAARTIGLGLVGGLLVIGAGIATLSSATSGGQFSSSTALTTRPYRLVAPALRWRLRALAESVKPTPFVSLLELPG